MTARRRRPVSSLLVDDQWHYVLDGKDRSLPLTGVVHREDHAPPSNGRLRELSDAEVPKMLRRCAQCQRRAAQPTEGKEA
jgi:hypothetical protein